MKKAFVFGVILSITMNVPAQSVSGTFSSLRKQLVKLVGFSGFDTYTIDSVMVDQNGQFSLNFNEKDYGMGMLISDNGSSYLAVLDLGENLQLKGENFEFVDKIEIVSGTENQSFAQYAAEHPRREQALSAWRYLDKIYTQDSLFAKNDIAQKAIFREKQRVMDEDRLFVERLPDKSYIKWYLPIRKLVTSVATIAQYQTEEIPSAIAAFRNIDHADVRLQKSGLLADLIEAHFWLIENSGRPLDSVFIEMNTSIDIMVDNLIQDEKKLNEISAYLFKLLEKRSLSKSSEHLVLKLLNEQGCTLDNDFSAQLESYRAMKKGNTAPNFDFKGEVIALSYETAPQRLSDLKSRYNVVVFGASWCLQCPQELLKLAKIYDKLKSFGMEVIVVSLDEEAKAFRSFCEIFPFISICDYQKWESKTVKDYHVFATPTIYLLNAEREILLRPNSVAQLEAWVYRFLE